MPRQISGKKCKEIAKRKASEATTGKMEGILFGRVMKNTGDDHFTVAIQAKHGPFEVRASLKKCLRKRGATPVTPNTVVGVFFGKEFDPMDQKDLDSITKGSHFSIDAILSAKQAYSLQKKGEIPDWMVQDMKDEDEESKAKNAGFEFDYGTVKKSGADSDSDSEMDEEDIDDV